MRSRHFVKYILLCCVFLAACLLRFYALDASSLWSDEGNTWALMSRSMAQIARDAAADIHPPGYYWLLRLWTSLAGTDAYALRSASALLGVALVLATYAIGRRLALDVLGPASEGEGARSGGAHSGDVYLYGVTAASIAAVNAFQIYYSQEARMYMLLALESALLVWSLLALLRAERVEQTPGGTARSVWLALAAYGACAAAGLWTHYSFPIMMAATGALYLLDWSLRPRLHRVGSTGYVARFRPLLRFIGIHLLVLLAYAPWLRTALTSVFNWPKGGIPTPPLDGLQLTLHMLLFGPLRNVSEPSLFWLAAGGILPLLGGAALMMAAVRRQDGSAAPFAAAIAPLLWLLAPVGLMFGLGLFSDAFLKFLLVASPAWCLLIAGVPWLFSGRTVRIAWCGVLLAAALSLSARGLPGYYADPQARDNYAGVARYIVAQPASLRPELVILNAPGQREVWDYYAPDVPVLALPQSRPPEPSETVATLAAATEGRERMAALFWATDESDPDRIVETWLDQHAFKTLESWQGNLRFVWYQRPGALECVPYDTPPTFGNSTQPDQIQLTARCQAQRPHGVFPGEAAVLGLRWLPLVPLEERYKVTVQLLDARSQVIAQRDSEPAGGSAPTVDWQPGETVADNHGVLVPFGTPPGEYRMIVALYNNATGERLAVTSAVGAPSVEAPTALEIGHIEVLPWPAPIPAELVPAEHRSGTRMGPVVLAGYDLYKKGSAHAPDAPLQPGDLLHVTLYWQAPAPLPQPWPSDQHFTLRLGEEEVTAPLAGGLYPTAEWQQGTLVRGEFDIRFDGRDTRPVLQVDNEQQRLAPVPAPTR